MKLPKLSPSLANTPSQVLNSGDRGNEYYLVGDNTNKGELPPSPPPIQHTRRLGGETRRGRNDTIGLDKNGCNPGASATKTITPNPYPATPHE